MDAPTSRDQGTQIALMRQGQMKLFSRDPKHQSEAMWFRKEKEAEAESVSGPSEAFRMPVFHWPLDESDNRFRNFETPNHYFKRLRVLFFYGAQTAFYAQCYGRNPESRSWETTGDSLFYYYITWCTWWSLRLIEIQIYSESSKPAFGPFQCSTSLLKISFRTLSIILQLARLPNLFVGLNVITSHEIVPVFETHTAFTPLAHLSDILFHILQ